MFHRARAISNFKYCINTAERISHNILKNLGVLCALGGD